MKIARLAKAVALATVIGTAGTTLAWADNTTNGTFEGWTNDAATRYNGRIPRDVYLNEMGRRWDADAYHRGTRDAYLNDLRTQWDRADPSNRGLTPAEVSQFTGKVDSSASGMPKSGSGVQPGNMGPANSKGQ